MSAGWIAAGVRARLLLRRRLGRERARAVAESRSLGDALALLAATGYAVELEPAHSLEEAQRAVARSVLFHLRLLAGWLPPGGAGLARALAAWFELVNLEERLAFLGGAELRQPFDLGALAIAWPAAAQAQTAAELRSAIAASAWGDPGGETAETVHFGLRLSWARRVLGAAPELSGLVAGALALLVARELFVAGRPVELLTGGAIPVLGPGWETSRTLGELGEGLPERAAWALADIDAAERLWEAEAAWWERVEQEGERLARRPLEDRAVVAGVAALLAADAWRTSAALALADRGGPLELREALGAHA
ncbi:MAG TPA: hypothetical protein VEG40_02775 [Gaiellaceae bacterium]|nr:hypothetical protein [Gaiellaceae bacterium]HYA08758.1 hypothetical protein [Gaiellaceae bacterium]